MVVLDRVRNVIKQEGIIFLVYGGCITQQLITDLVDTIENKVSSEGIAKSVQVDLSVIFIEMSQNLLKYGKKYGCDDIIAVSEDEDNFYLKSINLVDESTKLSIEKVLDKITSLSKEDLKKEYKRLRKTKINKHQEGGGIGLYEIAMKSDELEFEFEKLNNNMYNFSLMVVKKKERNEKNRN